MEILKMMTTMLKAHKTSQSSQSSEEMDSSGEEEEEHVDPWWRSQNEVCNRHEAQLESLYFVNIMKHKPP